MTDTQNNRQVEPSLPHLREEKDAGATLDRLSMEEISSLAYELWEQRGGKGGSPVGDWLEAERLLREHGARAA